MSCLNCGADLHGDFCHVCGQKASAHHLGFHDVVHEATHEFLHLDGKILQTMKLLLFKPGQLTREFIDGKRVRYISPIRLYLTWSVIFFALTAIVPGARESIIKVNTPALRSAEAKAAGERVSEAFAHNIPRAMFVLMPFFALLTWTFYRKRQPYYIPHLYSAIHFHAFVFFVLALIVPIAALGPAGKGAGQLLFLAVFPYHFLALRRVFAGTFWRSLAIGVIYWFAIAGTVAGVLWLALKAA